MNDIDKLNNLLFEQLAILNETNVKDDDFDKIRLKAETIYQIADRVIKNSELNLRYQVWSATRRFNIATREHRFKIGRSDDVNNTEYQVS